jgi:hypothetical protein
VAGDLDHALAGRLGAAGVDLSRLFGPGLGPWEAWLRLRDHDGPRATLVDLYLLEAASRGIDPVRSPQPTGSGSRQPPARCHIPAALPFCPAAIVPGIRMR